MAIDVERLVAEIRPDRYSYLSRTAQRLGLSEDEAHVLGDELVHAGRCEWRNERKRSIRRVASPPGGEDRSSGGSPVVASLSELARDLWDALPPDGEQVTNVEIRSRDEFAEKDGRDLQEARRELKRAGLVELRSGRDGGGLRRIVDGHGIEEADGEEVVAPPPGSRVAERLEHELYTPFCDWLIQELDTDAFAFATALVTARSRRQGKWTQPDVCQLTVTNFENLPAVTVELSSYELKRRADAGKLEAVYEAAAHGRWAHRANLVLEVKDRESKVAPEILKDGERFGLGVYKLWFTEPTRVSVQRLVASRVQAPEDSDLDDMISVVLGQLPAKDRNAYKRFVR